MNPLYSIGSGNWLAIYARQQNKAFSIASVKGNPRNVLGILVSKYDDYNNILVRQGVDL